VFAHAGIPRMQDATLKVDKQQAVLRRQVERAFAQLSSERKDALGGIGFHPCILCAAGGDA